MGLQSIGRRGVLSGAGGLLATPAIVRAQGQNGVALVVGNSKYTWEASLPNVGRDGLDIAKRFQAMGLKTELVENFDLKAMRHALAKFGAAARGANFAAFYFAGHGVAGDNVTYIVPVDADLSDPSSLKNLISSGAVGRVLNGAAHALALFDSCRNNPSDGWRQRATEEQATVRSNSTAAGSTNDLIRQFPHSLRLTSTAPGHVAMDGPPGQNSPFATSVMRQLEADSIDLKTLAGKVRHDLLITTQGRQLLWDVNAYKESFSIGGAGHAGASSLAYDPSTIVELNKAYSFAQQSGIPLPAGLVAVRPSPNAPHAKKVGSFTFEDKIEGQRHLQILLVLGVDDGGAANIVLAVNNGKTAYWRLVDATASGDKLNVQPRNTSSQYSFDWHDANSGSVGQIGEHSSINRHVGTAPFTRLDG